MRGYNYIPHEFDGELGEWVIYIIAKGSEPPLQSFAKIRCLMGEMLLEGFIPARNECFRFSFKRAGVLTVTHKKSFMNLPKEIRNLVLRKVLGPRRIGMRFEL